MSINLQLPELTDLEPRLTVIGIGGAGCNAVNNMIAAGLTGVEFVVANTDAQALTASSAEHRIQLGVNLTEGLGAGARPEVGEAAAEEATEEIRAQLSGSHMVFLAAGMGGGTGTGAISIIARIARDMGILTVGVVTKPFQFEGSRRMRLAEAGVDALQECVDTLIVIPNQNLFRIANEKTTFAEAFVLADHVLYSGVACIVDLIIKEGLINLDFADVRTVMADMGTAMMGTGEATGERRATLAAEEAIANPLLDDLSLDGAKGLLLSIIGGPDLTLYEVDEAASRVRREVDAEATIIVGAAFDAALEDKIRVSIVASGMGRRGANPAAPAMPKLHEQSRLKQAPAPAVSKPTAAAASSQDDALSSLDPGPDTGADTRGDETTQPPPIPAGQVQDAHEDDLGRRLSAAIQPHGAGQGAEAPGSSVPEDPSMSGIWEDGDAMFGDGVAGSHRAGAEQGQPEHSGEVEPGGQRQPIPVYGPDGQGADGISYAPQWVGPSGVVVEDGHLPVGAPLSDEPLPQVPSAHRNRLPEDPSQPAGFQPEQPPADIRRQGGRRMPTVDDFPPVVQQEYHARVGEGGVRPAHEAQHQGAQALQSRAAGAMSPAPQKAPRRRTLFERLTGINRKQSDSHSQAEMQRDYAQDNGQNSRAAPADQHSDYGDSSLTHDSRSSSQRSDRKTFFGGRRKG